MFEEELGLSGIAYLFPVFHKIFHVQDVAWDGIGFIACLHVCSTRPLRGLRTDFRFSAFSLIFVRVERKRQVPSQPSTELGFKHSLVALGWVHVSESWTTLTHLTQWTSTTMCRARLRA